MTGVRGRVEHGWKEMRMSVTHAMLTLPHSDLEATSLLYIH